MRLAVAQANLWCQGGGGGGGFNKEGGGGECIGCAGGDVQYNLGHGILVGVAGIELAIVVSLQSCAF